MQLASLSRQILPGILTVGVNRARCVCGSRGTHSLTSHVSSPHPFVCVGVHYYTGGRVRVHANSISGACDLMESEAISTFTFVVIITLFRFRFSLSLLDDVPSSLIDPPVPLPLSTVSFHFDPLCPALPVFLCSRPYLDTNTIHWEMQGNYKFGRLVLNIVGNSLPDSSDCLEYLTVYSPKGVPSASRATPRSIALLRVGLSISLL